jgi:hypothetical protein
VRVVSRKVTIEVDLDELPTMISEGVQQCLGVHRVQLTVDGRVLSPEEVRTRWREVGNNVAQTLALYESEETP